MTLNSTEGVVICEKITGVNDTIPGMNDTAPGLNDTATGLNDTTPGVNDTAPGMNDTIPGLNDTSTLNDTVFCFETTPNDTVTEMIYHPLTDELLFTISLQVADHYLNTAGSVLGIGVTLSGDTGTVGYGTTNVDVLVTGQEYPYLVFEHSSESFNYWEKQSG